MNGIFRVSLLGLTRWLTGLLIGRRGYAKTFVGYITNGLDIILGITGAFIGGYLFFWPIVAQTGPINRYAVAVLGSISLVTLGRLAFATYSPAKPR